MNWWNLATDPSHMASRGLHADAYELAPVRMEKLNGLVGLK